MVIAEYYRGFEKGQEEATLGFPPASRYFEDTTAMKQKAARAYFNGYRRGYDCGRESY